MDFPRSPPFDFSFIMDAPNGPAKTKHLASTHGLSARKPTIQKSSISAKRARAWWRAVGSMNKAFAVKMARASQTATSLSSASRLVVSKCGLFGLRPCNLEECPFPATLRWRIGFSPRSAIHRVSTERRRQRHGRKQLPLELTSQSLARLKRHCSCSVPRQSAVPHTTKPRMLSGACVASKGL